MIIDTHQHVLWQGRDIAAHLADMDEQGIDLAWLLTSENPEFPRYGDPAIGGRLMNPLHVRADGSHPGIILEDLLKAREKSPSRYIIGYCPNPELANACALFEAAAAMHGVRVCGEWKFRMLFDDPRCLELFQCAGRLKAPVVLHLDVPYLPDGSGDMVYQPRWFGGTVENLERALIACPETVFIGHAPGFWREISGDADREPQQYPIGPVTPGGRVQGMLERYENLYADLSAGSALRGLKRDLAKGREFLIRFSEKLLFGRDDYGGALKEYLMTLDLPAEVARKIFSANASSLVSIC